MLGDVNFYDFVFELVPRCRKRLADLNRSQLLEQFVTYDADGSGFLSRDECEEIVKQYLGTPNSLDDKTKKEE